jgi:hypothetical protein
MNLNRQACVPDQRLAKATLLAMLDSKLDTTRAIVVSTGEIIDISQLPPTEILPHINDGTWVFFEELLPRRMLVINKNWQIVSFYPRTRMVCVKIFANSGMRLLNFTLNEIVPKF